MARGLMDRLQVEEREPEQAKRRAIVIDYDTAKWLFGIIISCGVAVAGAAWYVATTVTDVDRRVTTNEAELVAVNSRIDNVQAQFAAIQGSITEGRVSDASIVSSLTFIRDAVTSINGRLDRIENKVDGRP